MDDYETPKWLLEIAFPDGRYFDPCPLHAKQEGHDGLKESWPTDRPVFINPPWSDPFPWVEKATFHSGDAAMLLPVDSTTKWWVYSRFWKVSFIDVRLKFIAWRDFGQKNLLGERAFNIEEAPARKQASGVFACCWWRKVV